MTPIIGWAPDMDPATPGVVTDCTNLVPYTNGMEGGPAPVTPSGTPPLAAACIGAAITTNLAGARRILAGTTTKLYELSGGSWSDVSRGSAYTGGIDTRWIFAQFGDAALATNRTDTIQRSTGSAFADISGAPKAEIIFSVGPQVMALNVNDGTEKTDGWQCCGLFDETSWTPSLATQAASGRLVATAGAITAGARLGEYAVAYKNNSIYLGQYVGSPVVWQWLQVPSGDTGCVGKEALCDIGGVHFFIGEDNIWLFDGTRPTPIADQVIRQWFFDNSNPSFRYRSKCVYDKQSNRVWIFFPLKGSLICNGAVVFHVPTKRWGRADLTIQACLQYTTPGVTYDTLNTISATYDGLPDVSYDSQYWQAGGKALSIVDLTNQVQILNGASVSSGFTCWDMGDDDQVFELSRLRLRFAPNLSPTTANVSYRSKMNSGDPYMEVSSQALDDGKFDVLSAARWHQAVYTFTGAVRITSMTSDMRAAGNR